jgi:hypothetical protein
MRKSSAMDAEMQRKRLDAWARLVEGSMYVSSDS